MSFRIIPLSVLFFFISSAFSLLSSSATAESLRCKTDFVQIGDTKADVVVKCGEPQITDSFCEKTEQRFLKSDGTSGFIESCENIDIWTYNPGPGQFWTHLYFEKGKLREMKYGERVK